MPKLTKSLKQMTDFSGRLLSQGHPSMNSVRTHYFFFTTNVSHEHPYRVKRSSRFTRQLFTRATLLCKIPSTSTVMTHRLQRYCQWPCYPRSRGTTLACRTSMFLTSFSTRGCSASAMRDPSLSLGHPVDCINSGGFAPARR